MRNEDSHSQFRIPTFRIPPFSLMPDFAYIARDLTGNRVEGTLAAGNEREAVAALSGRDLFPLKVASADGRAAGAKRSPRVQARVMAGTYGQLSALLGSGVPLLRSLEVHSRANAAQESGDGAGRRSFARAGRRDAGRRDGPPSARVRRTGDQHRPRRRRRRLPGRSARSAGQVHRAAGRTQEPRHRRAGLPGDPVRAWARSSSTC